MADFKTYYSSRVSATSVRLEMDFYPDIFSVIKNARCVLSITLLMQAMSDLCLSQSLICCRVMLLLKNVTAENDCFFFLILSEVTSFFCLGNTQIFIYL